MQNYLMCDGLQKQLSLGRINRFGAGSGETSATGSRGQAPDRNVILLDHQATWRE